MALSAEAALQWLILYLPDRRRNYRAALCCHLGAQRTYVLTHGRCSTTILSVWYPIYCDGMNGVAPRNVPTRLPVFTPLHGLVLFLCLASPSLRDRSLTLGSYTLVSLPPYDAARSWKHGLGLANAVARRALAQAGCGVPFNCHPKKRVQVLHPSVRCQEETSE